MHGEEVDGKLDGVNKEHANRIMPPEEGVEGSQGRGLLFWWRGRESNILRKRMMRLSVDALPHE